MEDRAAADGGLRAVFGRLRPRAEDLAASAAGDKAAVAADDIIESVLGDGAPGPWTRTAAPAADLPSPDGDPCAGAVAALARRLEQELRAAKRTHLGCGEVLLPRGLLRRVAADAWRMAESEPCGLRGCRLYVLLEAPQQQPQPPQQQPKGAVARIGAVRVDPATECTFELYLTLRQAGKAWNFLPQFLRNLTRGGTVVISPAYTLSKKKLYRSYALEQGESLCKTE